MCGMECGVEVGGSGEGDGEEGGWSTAESLKASGRRKFSD